MTMPGSSRKLLKVGWPDSVEGKYGPELSGVFWRESTPEVAWFAMKWDAAGRVLTVEFYPSILASKLRSLVESALEGVAASAAVGGSSSDVNLVLRRSISSEQAEVVSKRLAEVLGTSWEEPVARLLAAEPRGSQQKRSVMWYGIPREQIQWYPAIDPGRCDGCGKCVEYCKNGVLRLVGEPLRAEVANPFNCLVGCNSCASKCPEDAIRFPPWEMLQKL